METTQQIIEQCKNLISQPDYRKDYLLSIKEKCQGTTGYFSNYIPEEIIAAAGLHPLRIIGIFDTSKPSRHSLFNPVCSFAQDVFSATGSDSFSLLNSIIFPNSCDSLRVLAQMWEHNIAQPPAICLLHPINADSNSIQYFARELEKFAAKLQNLSGNNFSQDQLKRSIEKYNQTRSLLRQLYDTRKNNDSFLNGSDAIALMTAGLIMDRDEYNQMLGTIVEEGKGNSCKDNSRKRIMIIGPLVDDYALLNKIEQFGAYIVYDDITNGTRYCSLNVETEGNLYENLAKRYLSSAPSPTLNSDKQASEQTFSNLIDELDLDGIIFINQKFCEPHVHKYLEEVDILKNMGVNSLMLEVEHGRLVAEERDLLRIESFIEIAERS